MNSIAFRLISSKITSFICSISRRVSGDAGMAMRDSGWRVFKFVLARIERTRPTIRWTTSIRFSSSGWINSLRHSTIVAVCTDSKGSRRVSAINAR